METAKREPPSITQRRSHEASSKLSIPPKYAVSQVVGFLKGLSAIHIARVHAGRRRNFVGHAFLGPWVFCFDRGPR